MSNTANIPTPRTVMPHPHPTLHAMHFFRPSTATVPRTGQAGFLTLSLAHPARSFPLLYPRHQSFCAGPLTLPISRSSHRQSNCRTWAAMPSCTPITPDIMSYRKREADVHRKGCQSEADHGLGGGARLNPCWFDRSCRDLAVDDIWAGVGASVKF
ncbi:hypothetical protein P171DRAFT_271790 [Karstenula rhodostoma CBS 690.94]|uniref:Uncharacterized protein n=1 Tax=Karstenula rhodostoma CBS 690.94 TaxID=1392251 RepID=A0A9P4UE08_9PLEO|nr:hypothetical protein P171DRAFT_271790 [Karstenula rhodostoma CBS 690.94]